MPIVKLGSTISSSMTKPGSHDGYVNSQNYRVWLTENLHTCVDKSLHLEKTVFGVLFPENELWDHYSSRNWRQYPLLLHCFLIYCVERFNKMKLSHTFSAITEFLKPFFNDRLISTSLWPLGSLNLTPLNFFSWGTLKNKVFRTPENITLLK